MLEMISRYFTLDRGGNGHSAILNGAEPGA